MALRARAGAGTSNNLLRTLVWHNRRCHHCADTVGMYSVCITVKKGLQYNKLFIALLSMMVEQSTVN